MPTVASVVQPYAVFTDLDGSPLEDGNVYVGTVGLNPLIEANRVSLYADSALAIPIAQPVKTVAGVMVRSGSPTYVYVAGATYSIIITDKNGRIVYSALTAPQEPQPLVTNWLTIEYDITAAEIAGGSVVVNKFYKPGYLYRYGTNTVPSVTDMTAAFQSAVNQQINGGVSIELPDGDIRVSSKVVGVVTAGLAIHGQGIGRTRLYANAALGLFEFTAGASAFNTFTLEGFSIVADAGANTGSGIKITSGSAIPSVTLRDIMMLTSGANWFLRPIHLINCGESFYERVFIYGISVVGGAAFYITNSGAPLGSGTVYKFIGCAIYNNTVGVELANTTNPGIEGVQFWGCDFVSVSIGIKATSSIAAAVYVPTQLTWMGGHINAAISAFDLNKFTQVMIQGGLFYSQSAAATGQIELFDCSNVVISGNEFVQTAGGCPGIRIDTSSAGPFPIGVISNNNFNLGVGQTCVVLADATGLTNGLIQGNTRFGGTLMFAIGAGTLDNTVQILDNSPQDSADCFTTLGATVAAININGIRASFIDLPTPGGAVVITSITSRRVGDRVTFNASSNLISIQHNATIALANGVNYTFTNVNASTITLEYGSGNAWHEVARSG
jgi:hypothetical protein